MSRPPANHAIPSSDARSSVLPLESGNGDGALPALSADLVLMHAPAFFDFRERRDIYFPFLGTSGDVPITPLYE